MPNRSLDYEWEQLFLRGHKLVIRAMRPDEGGEEDIALANICAKALLLGVKEPLIAKCMKEKSEDYLINFIRQRTH
jgi:hypothetical protein